MRPCLLLALILLGMATTCHPAPAPQPAAPAPHTNCTNFIYLVINQLLTFSGAQDYCRTALGGNLASVHSAGCNSKLRALAYTHRCYGPWIGARTYGSIGHWTSRWADGSAWNYANWGIGHPWHLIPTCATLRTRDGIWRSHPCLELRPFICEYCGAQTSPQ